MEITYINNYTYNIDKLIKYFKDYNIKANIENINIPSIESNSLEDILNYKTKYISDLIEKDVISIDMTIEIPSLNNFPNTKTKYIIDTIGVDGIKLLLNSKEDKAIYLKEIISFTKYNEEPITFSNIYELKLINNKLMYNDKDIGNDYLINKNIINKEILDKLISYLYQID